MHQELEEELHKPIIRKFEKRKVYSSNIWGADKADMQLISKHFKGISIIPLLWVARFKDKKRYYNY